MEPAHSGKTPFRLGEWVIHPADGTLRSAGSTRRLEPQVMELLVLLASRPGEVFPKQELLDAVWRGRFVSEDSLTGAVSQLRKALGDESRSPRYIETIPKRGYRVLATREALGAAPASPEVARGQRHKSWAAGLALLVLLAGGVGAAWLRSRSATATVASLAVLPLKNLSRDPQDAALADGLTAALITELAKLHPLRVISHTSVMRYRDSWDSTPAIARQLHVDAILEGSVAREGRRVRVDTQLVDARSDTHLWAESYDRDLGDVLQLRAEIAGAVSRGIRVRLVVGSSGRVPIPRAVSPDAMEAYLKGRAQFDQRTPEGLRQARVYFDRAARLDPGFAEAFAGLAEASAYMIDFGLPPQASSDARAAALKALELDPDLAEARTAHATILAFLDWDLAGSEKELRRALELQPGLARARRAYAYLLSAQGRHDQAIREARQALALDPLHLPAHWDVAEVLLLARRFDEVPVQMQAALDLDPGASNAHFFIALAHWFQGKERESYAAYRTGLQAEGLTREVLEGLDATFARDGVRGVFRSVARYLERQPLQSPAVRRHVGVYYAAAGDNDRAMAILEQAYRERSPALLWLPVSPWVDPLRSDPRFRELLGRLPFAIPAPAGP